MSERIAQLLTSGGMAQGGQEILTLSAAALGQLPPNLVRLAMEWFCETGKATQAMALHAQCQAAGIATPLQSRCAVLLSRAGQREAAQTLLESWRPNDQTKPWEWMAQAHALAYFDRQAEAAVVLAQATKAFPRQAKIVLMQAEMYFQAGDRTAALGAYERAIALDPNQPAQAYLTARVLREQPVDALGLRLYLPAHVIGPVILKAILSGGYEGHERQAVLSDLRDQDRVLELGSGIGAMALWIKQARPGIPVTTVEANPDLAAVIRRNFDLNGCDATLIEGVAALTDGEVAFHLADEFWASSTYALPETSHTIQRQSVNVNRLIDDLSPTILVMDVEGGEVDLVPQLRLDGIRRVVIEMHPKAASPTTYSSVFKALLDAGFNIDRTLGRAEVFVFDRPD